jgi:hypothetical protein
MKYRIDAAMIAATLTLMSGAAWGQCEGVATNYQGITQNPGVLLANGQPGTVRSFAQYDPDGFNTGGPNLMVMAGEFASAGGLTGVNGLVAWDGSAFVNLGSPTAPLRPVNPFLLTVVPSGPQQGLYAGSISGVFRYLNGVWSQVSTVAPTAMIAWDPDQAGATPYHLVYTVTSGAAAHVMRWDGVNQFVDAVVTRVGGGATLESLTIYDPDGAGFAGDWLVFSGWFDNVNGTANFGSMAGLSTFPSLGGTVSSLSGGMNGRVRSITQWKRGTPNNALALIGDFTAPRTTGSGDKGAIYDGFTFAPFTAGQPFNLNASRVMTWDPDGPGGSVERVVVNAAGGGLIRQGVYAYNAGTAGFEFLGADGLGAGAIGVWDVVGNRSQPEWVFAGGNFAQGGWVTTGSTQPGTTRYNSVARTRMIPSGSTTMNWLPLPNEGVVGRVIGMGAANVDRSLGGSDRLYVSGDFQELSGLLNFGMARSAGTGAWLTSGTPTGLFQAFTRFRPGASPLTNDTLYAGGSVFARMSAPVGGPNSWTTVATMNAGGAVRALMQFDPDGTGPIATSVLVGGTFTQIGGFNANRLAYYTPATGVWGTLGTGFNGAVNAFTLFDFDGNGPGAARLVVGGEFTTAGGVAASRLAYWDGVQWFAMPDGGPNGPVYAMLAQNQLTNNPAIGRLTVGGLFTAAGGRPCSNIAQWQTGSVWTDAWSGVNGAVTAIAQIDLNGTQNQNVDQNGPEVIIGGRFTGSPQPGRPAIRGIARLGPGAQWNPIGQLHGFGGAAPEVTGITQVFSATAGGRPRVLVGGNFAFNSPDNPHQNLVAIEESTPYIRTAPSAVTGACNGGEVTFTVAAQGPGLVYRWQKNLVNLFPGPTGTGSTLSGVDGPTLTISGVTAADHGSYRCVVTNACGSAESLPGGLTGVAPCCGTSDFNCDGDFGTDADIESFFACLGGTCPDASCGETSDFNRDGDFGTDADIEAFFRVLAGGNC